MALKEYLLLAILATIPIGISSALTWNPNIHRYESYDLERGPVFYEAYYPDGNEDSRNNYQEKRYFDRGAVLERTYQVPSDRLAYPEDGLQVDSYPSRTERVQYPDKYIAGSLPVQERKGFPEQDYSARSNYVYRKRESIPQDQPDQRSLDIKEISNLARRAISRDLETWNVLENYLDRAKYQDTYPRQIVNPEYTRETRPNYPDSLRASQLNTSGIRRLTVRDLANRNPLETFDNRYKEQETTESRLPAAVNTLKKEERDPRRSIVDYPPENIFEPRPQVINYVFSKPIKNSSNKGQMVPERKETPKEPVPRNYGDNLIQEEMKKAEENKDVKVTSIEISEVPRHKTRHHHGEWPKRDYSHRHQS